MEELIQQAKGLCAEAPSPIFSKMKRNDPGNSESGGKNWGEWGWGEIQ